MAQWTVNNVSHGPMSSSCDANFYWETKTISGRKTVEWIIFQFHYSHGWSYPVTWCHASASVCTILLNSCPRSPTNTCHSTLPTLTPTNEIKMHISFIFVICYPSLYWAESWPGITTKWLCQCHVRPENKSDFKVDNLMLIWKLLSIWNLLAINI